MAQASSGARSRTEWAFLAALAFCTFALFFLNLGNHYLWQDEAQTALLAKTILARGAPYGTDGKNFFSQELGAEYGENFIWRWHTWLSFYLVAASFKLLGITTLAARLPSALFGAATVFLLYFFAKTLWEDWKTAAVASVFLMVNVPFLLLSRQCRYYSMAAFFALLGLFAYLRLLQGKRNSLLLFTIAGVLLFHTHHIYGAALLGATAVHCLLFNREQWKRLAQACAAVGLLCLPWGLWLAGMRYGEVYGGRIYNIGKTLSIAGSYLWQIQAYVLPGYFLLGLLAVHFSARDRSVSLQRAIAPTLASLALPLIFSAVTWGALAVTAPGKFFRYLSPIIAPLQAVAAHCSVAAYRLNRLVGAILLASPLALHPLTDYFYEITHDYDGPIEGIVTYLNRHALPGDTVAITYGDLPLKFYTPLRVVGGLTGEDLSPAKTAEWIIIRAHIHHRKDQAVHDYLRREVDLSQYRRIILPYPDVPFENRESPEEHLFRTARDQPPVTIYRRIEPHRQP
jgi:4-amino-4-deoxy-L-arabinose transferase-like glycosyltransferase